MVGEGQGMKKKRTKQIKIQISNPVAWALEHPFLRPRVKGSDKRYKRQREKEIPDESSN